MRTIGPPPPLVTVPSVICAYWLFGGVIFQLAAKLWFALSEPLMTAPTFQSGGTLSGTYQRSDSSTPPWLVSSAPTKVEESQAPLPAASAGTLPACHAVISFAVSVDGKARIPVWPLA